MQAEMNRCSSCRRNSTSSETTDEKPKDYMLPRSPKDTLALALQESSIHGVGHVWNNRGSCHGIFWLVILGLSTSAMILTFQSYAYEVYFQRRIYSATELRSAADLPIPSVTLCNKVLFSRKKLEAMNLTPRAYNLLMAKVSPPFAMNLRLTNNSRTLPLVKEADASIRKVLAKNNFTFKELVRQVSYSCEELVLGCSLNRQLLSSAECCGNMIPIPTMSGLCHTYYVDKSVRQQFLGDFMGLTLYMRVPQDDAPELSLDIVKVTGIIEKGIQVTLISRTFHPSSVATGHGILVPPSTITSLEVSVVEKNREDEKAYFLDSPIDSCVPDDEIAYTKNRELLMSTGANCYIWAISECSLEFYHCTIYAGDPVDEKTLCGTDKALEFYPKLNILLRPVSDQGDGNADFHECYQNRLSRCKSVCEETTFTYTVSTTSYSNIYNFAGLDNFTSRNDTGVVNIYYAKFDYVHTKTWREGINEILSKQGGQMGLLLGCSIISIVEAVVFTTLILVASCKSFLRKLKGLDSKILPVRALPSESLNVRKRECQPECPKA